MKEFSKDVVSSADRRFEIGGEEFEWTYPYAWDLFDLLDENRRVVAVGTDLSEREVTEQLIEWTGLFLTDEGADRWKVVAHRRDDPIPAFLFGRLFEWLVQEASGGRPTVSPSASEPGGGSNGASSPAGSPSTVATPTG